MRDVTAKPEVRRRAVAEGYLTVRRTSLEALATGTEKGDLPTLARVVGLAWAKHLPMLLPDAHPVRLTQGDVRVEAVPSDGEEARLRVSCECTAIDRTGVELEALAMVMGGLFAVWDALKPYEKDENGQYPVTAIEGVRVVQKRKEKHYAPERRIHAAVIVATDSRRESGDQTGPLLMDMLESAGHDVVHFGRVPDEVEAIKAEVRRAGDAGAALVIVAGGTGPGPRDVTPEALLALGGIELPGFGERLRDWSAAQEGPFTILTRATCRLVEADGHRMAVAALPGHPRAVPALLPLLDAMAHAVALWRGPE